MAEVVIFHHVQGLTDGVRAFADDLRAHGHVVHTPDLYEGRTFADFDTAMAFARATGFEPLAERARRAADALPGHVVYGGFSLGAAPAQELAQSRPDALGALLFHAALPLSEFGGEWPAGVPLQIHVMEKDEYGDVEVARELAETVADAELFLYPGEQHLFTDRSLPAYDSFASALVIERVLSFLERSSAN